MLTVFEREKVKDYLGDENAKLGFLQKYLNVARFSKSHTVFNVSGVFQLAGGPPVIVLPWFIRENSGVFDRDDISENSSRFFAFIREIKQCLDASIDLDSDASAIDIVLHSFLLRLLVEVPKLLSFNFHSDVSEVLDTIKGRWNIAADITRGPKPLKFTCSYGSLEKNIPVLIFIKSFLKEIMKGLCARKNRKIASEILLLLKEVDDQAVSRRLFSDANLWVKQNPEFREWSEICKFAFGFSIGGDVVSKEAGVAYQFQVDKFFEEVAVKVCSEIEGCEVHVQSREDILGGAFWVGDNGVSSTDPAQVSNSRYASIPDIVVESKEDYCVVECKYKPFRIPLINADSIFDDMIAFNRDDRNQLLSFMMSLRPSSDLSGKRITFSVLFPSREIEMFKFVDLVFPSAKLHMDPVVRNIIQNRREFGFESGLRIRFIGMNVSRALSDILSRKNDSSRLLGDILIGNKIESISSEKKTSFQKVLEKRVALTSIIVEKGKNDRNLGRVKLAKVIYMADTHLNLGLQADYKREAAGPLDQRMIYNEKYGVEAIGSRDAFFNAVQVRRESASPNRIRYCVGSNFAAIAQRARILFVDKYEQIETMVSLMMELDTDQSEIVATLYACWNDLIASGRRDVSDSEIIQEFQNGWHDSKKRFLERRLIGAIEWMKRHDLVPNGIKVSTRRKNIIDVSGF